MRSIWQQVDSRIDFVSSTRFNHFNLMKAALLCLLLLPLTSVTHANWPSWRGDLQGSGHSQDSALPTTWSPDKNVVWRVELPEPGNSTPIIHGDRIFITQPLSETHWRGVMCFNRLDGKLLWKNGLTYDKPETTHRTNPYCSASPTTDGQIVIASFGSAGVVAYDLDGKQLWHRDFGPISHEWGNSTSPILHGDLCIHYHGPGKGAFLTALNKTTGETVWTWNEPDWAPGERTDGFKGQGKGIIGSFSTPIITSANGRSELIMSFPMELKAFDPVSGKVLWTCSGLNPLVYTSPMVDQGIVVALGGYYGNSIAVKTGGSGDVTPSRLWQEIRHNGGIGTGIIKDGFYYYHDSGGVTFCLDIQSGKTLWKDRLPGSSKSWGSFVLAGDTIYSLSQTGQTVVFKANPQKLEILSQADVGEPTNSSLVPSKNQFIIRTHKALWCIGSK
jgi:outer membrane protein assembly factor BamB